MDPDTSRIVARGRIQPIGGGRALHVVESGERRPGQAPIVLVHGLPSFASDWADTPSRLAQRGQHVIAYDRIGYGDSTRGDPSDPADYTQRSNADDLRGLLDALQIGKAALVGWSYGGAVVQTFAAAYPERASHLVFVGSVGPAAEREGDTPVDGLAGRLATSAPGQAALRWMARVPPLARAITRAPLADAFSGADAVPPGWGEYTAAMLARPGTFEAWRAEWQRYDPAALQPEGLAMPALVVHGTDDRLVDYSVAEDLARRLPNAKLVPVFEGSHMLPVTHAERLAEEITRFVAP